jgi:AAHS family 4-hydroxybenzoate transporter-like MFS transporter
MSQSVVVDVSAIIERQRLNRFLVGLVVISWVVTFFDGFDMNVIGFAAPYLAAEFSLSKAMLGNVFSIGLLGTMIGGFLFGFLGDRIGRRPAVILATILFGVLTLCFAMANGYALLLTLRLLDGIAIGGMLPLIWALNIEYAPKAYRATIVTLIMVGYSLGSALGGPIANALIPRFGWPSVFVFGGLLSIVAGLALLLMLPESIRFLASRGRRHDLIAKTLRRLAPRMAVPDHAVFVVSDEAERSQAFRPSLLFAGELRRITPLLWLGYIFSSMTAFFLANWTPLVLEALQFTRTEAATIASINSLAGALGGVLLMRFTDRHGAIAIAAMPLLAIPLLLAAGFVELGHLPFLLLTSAIALALFGGHFGMHSIAGIFYPSAWRGNGAGWATSVAKIGSIAGPFIGGLILNTSLPVRHIFAILAICPAVVLVCVALIGRIHSGMLRRESLDVPPEPRVRLAEDAAAGQPRTDPQDPLPQSAG